MKKLPRPQPDESPQAAGLTPVSFGGTGQFQVEAHADPGAWCGQRPLYAGGDRRDGCLGGVWLTGLGLGGRQAARRDAVRLVGCYRPQLWGVRKPITG